MRFLVDAQLPPALARFLTERGHVAEHVIDIGPNDATDQELWEYAITHDAVIVTKDADFVDMIMLGSDSPVVVWVRLGNTRRAALLEWFGPLVERVVELIDAGSRLVELR